MKAVHRPPPSSSARRPSETREFTDDASVEITWVVTGTSATLNLNERSLGEICVSKTKSLEFRRNGTVVRNLAAVCPITGVVLGEAKPQHAILIAGEERLRCASTRHAARACTAGV